MNVTLLDVLQNANALEILVRILEEHSTGPHSTVCNLPEFKYRDSLLIFYIGSCESGFPNLL